MTDRHTAATRSYNMSRVRSKNTKPELLVRKYLFAHGLRFRLHSKNLPGKPDIVLPKYRTIILVNGCFWHGHTYCKYAALPRTNVDWWSQKIICTVERDQRNRDALEAEGWRVFTIWDCELKPAVRDNNLAKLVESIKTNSSLTL